MTRRPRLLTVLIAMTACLVAVPTAAHAAVLPSGNAGHDAPAAVPAAGGPASVAARSAAAASDSGFPLDFDIRATSGDLRAGKRITFDYTATNPSSSPLVFGSDAQVTATFAGRGGDDPRVVWSNGCTAGASADAGSYVTEDGRFTLPPSLAPGDTLTCRLSYVVQPSDIENGGVWTQAYYAPVGSDQPWAPGWYAFVKDVDSATPVTGVFGTARFGNTVVWTRGYWGRWDHWFSFQWKRDGVPIAGATDPKHVLNTHDIGHRITLETTGIAEDGAYITFESDPTAVVAKGVLKTATPTVDGTAKAGKTLTARAGTWTSGTTFRYQWYAGGKAVPGATGSTWKATSASVGKKVTVHVTGSKTGYTSATKGSAATKAVVR